MNPEHPPLFKALAAIPIKLFYHPDVYARFLGVSSTDPHSPWAMGVAALYGSAQIYLNPDYSPQSFLIAARIIPVLFGLLGGILAFYWGCELGKNRLSGLLSAILLLYYSEYLGHSCYVLLDVPSLVACASVATFGWRCWKRSTFVNGLLFILITALASQIKLPVCLFIVAFLFTLLCAAILRRSRKKIFSILLLALLTFAACYFACWLTAGFRFEYTASNASLLHRSAHLPPFPDLHSGLTANFITWLWEKRLLPETAIAVLGHTLSFSHEREYFLFGQTSSKGWYHYFLITSVLKTPLPFLLCCIVFPVLDLFRPRFKHSATRNFRRERALIFGLPFFLLALCVIFFRANLGHRYFLFVYFPLSVYAGVWLGRMFQSKNSVKRGIVIAVMVYHAGSCLWWHPHNATYFNLIGRNPYASHKILNDSSTDYGQDAFLLASELALRQAAGVNLSLAGLNYLPSCGIANYRWIDDSIGFPLNMRRNDTPRPDWPSAISVNRLERIRMKYPELYQREPDQILNSIVIYYP
ncbi:phospholipid carrier-dependent glycosyltransferase [Candidatus Sumerlaeota bacterium]|nr:phospholipid carrier-dependent glycosyltransferase [Candidatus Sumerlaeota bacterium]